MCGGDLSLPSIRELPLYIYYNGKFGLYVPLNYESMLILVYTLSLVFIIIDSQAQKCGSSHIFVER